MDDKRIAEIKARADKATQGPWLCGGGDTIGLGIENYSPGVFSYDIELATVSTEMDRQYDATGARKRGLSYRIGCPEADAEFIAHSRQDVADLVADLEKVHHRHRPVEKDGVNVCHECDGIREQVNPDAEPILWADCATIRDLDGDTTTETRTEAA